MHPDPEYTLAEVPPKVNEFRRVIRIMFSRGVVVFGIVVVLLLVILAIFAPLIAPYNPYQQNLDIALESPSTAHWLGTDQLGRDLLSRIIYGTRVSLMIGIVAVGIAAVIGTVLGLVAGYFGAWIDNIIMRFIDSLMAVPPLVLAIGITTALGGGLTNVTVALGIAYMPVYCRLMYGQVVSIKQYEYVIAGKVIGAGHSRIMFNHIFPNSIPPLIVLMTLQIGIAILAEASLSYLGIGIQPPTAAWGAMVNYGYRYLVSNPVFSIAPGIAVLLTVLAFNMVGDGLRDALDPRLRGTI